ncbi:MotA/TolQ/ExbB proton channel family protein [gamma proteobacterium IMCC2047]|nr:MotA/TolQ/ExbB proton channel family protein [gamma proteobacterium IMCC2047]
MMIKIFTYSLLLALLSFFVDTTFAADQNAAAGPSLQQLLNDVKQGSAQERKTQREREARFNSAKQQQAKLLADARAELAKLERRSSELEKLYDANAKRIDEKQQQLTERLGVLKELFGTVQAVAGDTRSQLKGSLVSAQYPNRTDFIDSMVAKMNSNTQLASMAELRELWFVLLQEMTESGRVVSFPAQLVLPDGSRREQPVVRVGSFNLVSAGQYLKFDAANNDLLVLPRQPAASYLTSATDLQIGSDSYHNFAIDPTGPTGGSFLAALIDSPDWLERIQQGREVGYLILLIGALALTLAVWRFIVLSSVRRKVEKQLQSPQQASADNPLGRVLLMYQEHIALPVEALELKLHEAILREIPPLEKWVNVIKLSAMVAPLLGLLGTVSGMILTFQALTIFGAGDPKAMAGGISSALVTTALGLCVAIPAIFLHALVSSRSKNIVQVLEEQAAGVIAEQAQISKVL